MAGFCVSEYCLRGCAAIPDTRSAPKIQPHPMSRIQSFPPISTPNAHTLILGSMPGIASLDANQYYAHPRNAFWTIIGEVLGIQATLPYAERTRRLAARGYALWDVLGTCHREGSLDSRIDENTMEVNDFADFLARHPGIDRVFFNGAAAERIFRRRVLDTLKSTPPLSLIRLPSTSPAHASLALVDKILAWNRIAR